MCRPWPVAAARGGPFPTSLGHQPLKLALLEIGRTGENRRLAAYSGLFRGFRGRRGEGGWGREESSDDGSTTYCATEACGFPIGSSGGPRMSRRGCAPYSPEWPGCRAAGKGGRDASSLAPSRHDLGASAHLAEPSSPMVRVARAKICCRSVAILSSAGVFPSSSSSTGEMPSSPCPWNTSASRRMSPWLLPRTSGLPVAAAPLRQASSRRHPRTRRAGSA